MGDPEWFAAQGVVISPSSVKALGAYRNPVIVLAKGFLAFRCGEMYLKIIRSKLDLGTSEGSICVKGKIFSGPVKFPEQ